MPGISLENDVMRATPREICICGRSREEMRSGLDTALLLILLFFFGGGFMDDEFYGDACSFFLFLVGGEKYSR